MGKLKNGKSAGTDEITGKMIKGGSTRVVDWIWRLCNMAFKSGVVMEDWSSAAIVPLYKGKEKRTECSNYRAISLSVVGKIYARTLIDRVCIVTEGLVDYEKGGFRAGRGV